MQGSTGGVDGPKPLRDYQTRALAEVEQRWAEGKRRGVFVLPTGGGKSRCAAELVLRSTGRGERVLAIAHRTELITQLAAEFQQNGVRYVGLISPAHAPSPHAPVQVASTQTLLARDQRPPADLLIPDEFHHYNQNTWAELVTHYPGRSCGFTATPELDGGKSLSGMADFLVVGATYSQLIADGFLLPCRVFQPPERLRKDLALDPVVAYQKYCPGQQTFVFTTTVAQAETIGEAFNAAGIPSAVVHGKTSGGKRRDAIVGFETGAIRVLVNAFLLTEGVNITSASACILARKCLHVGTYLQICGRILRPHPGQEYATLVDLTGASLKHGLPTEDREYSLEGRGIRRLSTEQIRSCPKCGMCVDPGVMECPNIEITTGEPCGFRWTPGVRTPPKFLSLELREVYAGSETPEPAKKREWGRLLSKGSVAQAVLRFRETFGHPPVWVSELPEERKREEYLRLRGVARARGFSAGWAAHQFKAALNAFPPWAWTRLPDPLT